MTLDENDKDELIQTVLYTLRSEDCDRMKLRALVLAFTDVGLMNPNEAPAAGES